MKELTHVFKLLLVSFSIVLLLKLCFFAVVIDGESMYPTLNSNQLLIANSISYRFSEPDRGDIIIFKPSKKFDVTYVKRIIAIPGDTIAIKDNTVYLNGDILEEPYIYEPMKYSEDLDEYELLPGEYFVMGDNRNNSSDSRWFGHIRTEQIIGKLLY